MGVGGRQDCIVVGDRVGAGQWVGWGGGRVGVGGTGQGWGIGQGWGGSDGGGDEVGAGCDGAGAPSPCPSYLQTHTCKSLLSTSSGMWSVKIEK